LLQRTYSPLREAVESKKTPRSASAPSIQEIFVNQATPDEKSSSQVDKCRSTPKVEHDLQKGEEFSRNNFPVVEEAKLCMEMNGKILNEHQRDKSECSPLKREILEVSSHFIWLGACIVEQQLRISFAFALKVFTKSTTWANILLSMILFDSCLNSFSFFWIHGI
jgi:hypothetical protein